MSHPVYFVHRAEELRAEAQRRRQASAARPEASLCLPLPNFLTLFRTARPA